MTRAFERQLGRFDPDVYKALAAGGDAEGVRAKIEAMAGPSGFMLFGTHDHGALLRLAGQKRKAIQYVVGNPLFALQMTQHDIRASLYAPLRVLLYEDEAGKTCVEYDRPSSLFGQFGNDRDQPHRRHAGPEAGGAGVGGDPLSSIHGQLANSTLACLTTGSKRRWLVFEKDKQTPSSVNRWNMWSKSSLQR